MATGSMCWAAPRGPSDSTSLASTTGCGVVGVARSNGSATNGILFRASDHLEVGGLVMKVPADDEQMSKAARILGAHGMAHFGRDHGSH